MMGNAYDLVKADEKRVNAMSMWKSRQLAQQAVAQKGEAIMTNKVEQLAIAMCEEMGLRPLDIAPGTSVSWKQWYKSEAHKRLEPDAWDRALARVNQT